MWPDSQGISKATRAELYESVLVNIREKKSLIFYFEKRNTAGKKTTLILHRMNREAGFIFRIRI
jgi:hypothetical protein